MRSPQRHGAEVRGVAVALIAVGVLVGLLGMHVLALHGLQHEVVPAMPGASGSHHLASESAESVYSQAPVAGSLEASVGCCDHGHGMDALMLCLGLIVAVGVLIAAVRSGTAASLGRWLWQGLRRPLAESSARAGPPYVFAFSVIRC